MATHYLGSAIARLNMSSRCTEAIHTTKVGPRPKDPPAPPDRFGKLLKVGTLGVLIERLVNGALEVVEKLHGLWKRVTGRQQPTQG